MAGYQESCPMQVVGEFKTIPTDKAKAFACVGGTKNMVTHKNKGNVDAVSFEWIPPSHNVGNITFQATVLENFRTYWADIEATLFVNSAESDINHNCTYQQASTEPLMRDVDFSGCGHSKACFLYPRHCEDNDCVAAVSFEYMETTDNYLVEMYADPGRSTNYVSVAFSSDDEMADGETYTCTASGSDYLAMSIQYGYNPGKENELLRSNSVSDAEVKHQDGRLQCRFLMQPSSSVERIKSSTATSDEPQTEIINFDKSAAWRIQLAWGQTIPYSDVISMHKDMPATTSSKVVIKEVGIHRGTAFHVLVKVHAALMIVAWTFLSGILTVISRHYRDMMPGKHLFGTKIWFQLHRGIAILVAIMTGVGVVVIFSCRGLIKKAAAPHAACGLLVMIFLGLQTIVALRRPDPGHKWRTYFNYGHRLLGTVVELFAGITMFLAFQIDYVTESMRSFGLTTLGIWLSVRVICHIGFEALACFCSRNASYAYLVNDDMEEESNTWVNVVTKYMSSSKSLSSSFAGKPWIPTVLMVIYVLFLAGCCISVLFAFLLY